MATVIDALVVTLGLDNAKFKKGAADTKKDLADTSKAATKTAQEMKAAGQQAGEFFKQVTGAALAFFAVLAGGRGLVDFTRETVMSNAALSRLAVNLGESSNTLFAWKRLVEQSGGNGDAFLGTVQRMSASLTELQLTGNSSILPYLRALGVGVADATGKARSFEEITLDVADKLVAMPDRANAYNIGKMMGYDEGTINVMLKGRSAVVALLEVQKRKASADDEAHKRSERLREAWEKLKQRSDDLMRSLLEKAMPTLEKLIGWLDKLLNWCEKNPEAVMIFFTGLAVVLGVIAVGMVALMAPLVALAAPFIVLAAKIAAVSAALAIAYSWFQKLVESEWFKKLTNSSWFKSYSGAINDTEGGESAGITPSTSGRRETPASRREDRPAPATPAKRRVAPAVGLSKEQMDALAADDRRLGLPQNSGYAQMMQESGGKSDAVSRAGARGWFQVMPKTQKKLEQRAGRKFDPENFEDARIMRAMLMEENLRRFGNTGDALRAYNNGWDRNRWNNPETANYSQSIERIRQKSLSSGINTGGAGASDRTSAIPSSNVSKQVSIGNVNVYTQATDAKGIARDMRGELSSQADTGMS